MIINDMFAVDAGVIEAGVIDAGVIDAGVAAVSVLKHSFISSSVFYLCCRHWHTVQQTALVSGK